MAIAYKNENGKMYIVLSDNFDGIFGDKLLLFLETKIREIQNLELDIEKIHYINSDGLESLINIYNMLVGLPDKRISFVKISPKIKEVVEKIGLLNIIPCQSK
jgi:anti-anti-sigma regulatory factor